MREASGRGTPGVGIFALRFCPNGALGSDATGATVATGFTCFVSPASALRWILFNINGCWDALTTLLDDLQQRGLMRGSWRSHFIVADSLDDIQKALS